MHQCASMLGARTRPLVRGSSSRSSSSHATPSRVPAAPPAAAAGFAATSKPARSKGGRRGGGGAGRRQQQQQQRRQQQHQQPDSDDDEEDEEELTELSQAQHLITVPDFAPQLCRELRGVFDSRFADPRATTEERFLWDYFHIPDQYTMHRTQAGAYFSQDLNERLVDALLEFGEKQLGCRAITPVWMSNYTDGCLQELHSDSPHGPFAFVLSLTAPGKAWEDRGFTGGETAILQPRIVGNYWQETFDPSRGLELRDLMQLVPSPFAQLTVFDPRLPHGVRAVHGTRDPQRGRLVLHGWFTDPQPFVEGGLAGSEAQQAAVLGALGSVLQAMMAELQALPAVLGILSVRLRVAGASGEVADVAFLADTLVVPPAAAGGDLGGGLLEAATVRGAVQHTVAQHLRGLKLPAREDDTFITLPLVFE